MPTFVESGYPDFVIDAWTGVWRRRARRPPIIAKLNAAINEGLKTAQTRTALARFSALPKVGTPAEFETFLKTEAPRWAEMVKLSGAKAE